MFKFVIDKDIELKILEEKHADEDFKCIDNNRDHLRKWLPWVDNVKDCDEIKRIIKLCLEQFVNNKGFTAGI